MSASSDGSSTRCCVNCRADFSGFPVNVPFCPFCQTPQSQTDGVEKFSQKPQSQVSGVEKSRRCAHCPKYLLIPTAKICDSCGKGQPRVPIKETSQVHTSSPGANTNRGGQFEDSVETEPFSAEPPKSPEPCNLIVSTDAKAIKEEGKGIGDSVQKKKLTNLEESVGEPPLPKRSKFSCEDSGHGKDVDDDPKVPGVDPLSQVQGTSEESWVGEHDDSGNSEEKDGKATYADAAKGNSPLDHPKMVELPKKKGDDALFSGTRSSTKKPSGGLRLPAGLSAVPEKSVQVTFHVILPVVHWEWNDANSRMHIRFGCPELGGWCDQGIFNCCKRFDSGLFEMSCILHIQEEVLRKPVVYKYVVYSPKTHEDTDRWERIPGHSWNPNRCLNVDLSKVKSLKGYIGKCDQYDTIAYPEKTTVSTTFVEKLKQTGRYMWTTITGTHGQTKGSQDAEFKVFEGKEMSKVCLEIYLEEFQKHLCSGNFPQGHTIHSLMDEIVHIFKSVFCPTIVGRVKPVVQESFKEVIQQWFDRVVTFLQESVLLKSEMKLLVGVLIAQSVKFLDINQSKLMKENFAIKLLKLLTLEPELSVDVCSAYEHLCTFLPEPQRSQAAISVASLCRCINNKPEFMLEWFRAIPLYHFLSGRSKPYKQLPLDPSKILWNDKTLSISTVKYTASRSTEFVHKYFAELEHVIKLDSELLTVLISLCPSKEFALLIERVPYHMAIAWMVNNVNKQSKVNELIDHITVLKKFCSDEVIDSELNDLKRHCVIMDTSVQLFCTLSTIFRSPDHTKLLAASISLFLQSVCKYDELYSKERTYLQSRGEAFTMIEEGLWDWIVDSKVVGGSVFGYTLSPRYWKGKMELAVWQGLLSNSQAVSDWHNIVRKHVHKRVHAVNNPDLKIELVCSMEEDIHSLLADIVMDAAIEAVDAVMSKPEKAQHNIEQLALKESVRVGQLLGRIMKNRYPALNSENRSFTVSFDDLLCWNFWPNFIKINGRKSTKLYKGLPEKCCIACTFGYSCFQDICQQLKSGTITLNDVKKIKENKDQMKRLCQAMEVYQGDRLSFSQLQLCIKQRCEEFGKFEECRNNLLQLYNHIQKYNIEGLPELSQDLKSDFGDTEINTLCLRDGKEFRLLCFHTASTLMEFAHGFSKMSKTEFFLKKWNETLRTSPPSRMIDVASIWKSSMDHCQVLCDELSDRTIKLSDVDKLFKDYQADLEGQLLSLFTHCNDTLGKKKITVSVVAIAKHIKSYWNLCRYRDVANVFLRLKQTLKLQTGDFSTVEKLSSKISVSMKDQTLEDVNESLVSTAKFLDAIVADDRKRKSLQKFADCQEVIHWIREATNDVSDLLNFVNVALATAAGGEGDLAQDMLSNLRAVGSGFGSLIYYHFPRDAGFAELVQQCQSLWHALADNPNLPSLLADCNRELAWYRAVKETQGSVEVTSYGQMENILKYGRYRVGCLLNKSSKTIHDVVSLKLEERDKKLPKTTYSLDELRDLESKLVLITGSNADNRTQVDHFLDILHSVSRIAEVLIDLQCVGNVKYSGWTLTVPCGVLQERVQDQQEPALMQEKELVQWLQKTAREMENELSDWQDEIANARTKYYELNYYTTIQLLTLRRELGKVKTAPLASVTDADVITLLHSVSSQVTFDIVGDAVREAVISQPSQQLADHAFVADLGQDSMKDVVVEAVESTLFPTPVISEDSNMQVSVLEQPLTEDDLNTSQQEILANVMKSLKYGSNNIVLMAFKECGDDADRYAIEDWCVENADNYDFEDEMDTENVSMSDDDGEQSPESDREDFVADLPYTSYIGIATPKKESVEQLEHISPKVQITKCQAIDANHPIVQDLISADYTEEESIAAVEYYGDDLEACLDYLSSRGEGENLFPMETQPIKEARAATTDVTVHCDEDAESRYLNLEELGTLLKNIAALLPASVPEARMFNTKIMKEGAPNLLVVSPENVLKTVLALFMGAESLPLPTQEEVLVCSETTSAEEVILLWNRALYDPGFKRIFCLVHAEKLSYQVSDKALRSFAELSQVCEEGYRLVIICSSKDEEKSHIISKLQSCRRPFAPHLNPSKYQEYLRHHFTSSSSLETVCASAIDVENSCVRVVTSKRSGMGKSLYIQRMEQNLLQNIKSVGDVRVVIPIHGPVISSDTILESLSGYSTLEYETCIFHFDIAPSILWKVDTILFSLLVLRSLCDSRGRVWRCKPCQLYAVEVTVPEKQMDCSSPEKCTLAMLELLPSVECVSPRHSLKLASGGVLMDQQEFVSATYQRVFQYLRRYAGGIDLDSFSYSGRTEGSPSECLDLILRNCGLRNPSWSEIRHFVHFLDVQLRSCELSVFCDQSFVGDVMSGLKGFVVAFMMRMSRDFATSSLQGEVARENEEAEPIQDLEEYQIRRHWEQSSHPYIFFNQDRVSITFVGFRVNQNGDLCDPTGTKVLQQSVMKPQLYTGLVQNRVNFSENCNTWKKGEMINKIGTVMGLEYVYDPDETYVLTLDNLIKMLAIQMRFRCGIPVIIMGETGCGKTRLIRYMCDLARQGMEGRNMLILKVHGGITETDVITFMDQVVVVARENMGRNMSTTVFFDEANTTDAIGLIKEIMCDRRLRGKRIPADINFIAACNPYRKHSEDMIKKLESAGLGFYVQATETQQKLGVIPLRQLVYRVLDLPPSMRPLVYDFGQLNKRTEADYIKQIVTDHVKTHQTLSKEDPAIIAAITRVLDWSQKYMRGRQDECSFVSLRDVERAMIVFEYFFEKMKIMSPHINEIAVNTSHADSDENPPGNLPRICHPDDISRSILLSLCVCYHARLQDRREYEDGVTAQFIPPLGIPGKVEGFRNEIKWCQQLLLDNMNLGANIAKNAALRENVFMMAVCVDLRIPLFLVGKPGSSKSLAKAIVQDNFHGQASTKELLRNFKQVHMFSYQCSQLSTPDSVIEVFSTAKRFQRKQDTTKYVSVVVLDEVGLAEDSPNLPLKALHPLLEDGTEGADKTRDGTDEIIEREKRVAFIGISNWALDPAKMNRGVMVTRGDPDAHELELSARGICSNKQNDPVRERLQAYFKPLAEAFMAICKIQEREFFGLRDFYSLIKMLYWMCEQSGHPPTWPQMEHAIRRNFGGLETLDPLKEFGKFINTVPEPVQLENFKAEIHHIVNPDCTRLGLIKTSLRTKDTSFHGENRYLLFLTENYAALDILKHYVMETQTPSAEERRPANMEPFILFGSSFPKDKEYTQVCRNINQIKICMETGRTVILLNLENLYESLYDLLNQYYIEVGGSRYVDLGLQTHRVKCRVHENFKLILIAEKNTVYEKFPTPLINRMEKHFVLTSSVLHNWQQVLLEKFQEWIHMFSVAGNFKEGDAFIGYQKDTPAAVVFQATNQLQALKKKDLLSSPEWDKIRNSNSLGAISPEEFLKDEEGSLLWQDAVLNISKCLLLQTAPDDALVRLHHTGLPEEERERMEQLYYYAQSHQSIEDYLRCQFADIESGGLRMQITTHSHLLSHDELSVIGSHIGMKVTSFFLHEFDTELDFSNKISPIFFNQNGVHTNNDKDMEELYDIPTDSALIVIQCDSGHLNGDLIACARYRIDDQTFNKRLSSKRDGCFATKSDTHVLFVIHLPHKMVNSSFVGFQGHPWISAHIDDLRPSLDTTIVPEQAMNMTISDLFYRLPEDAYKSDLVTESDVDSVSPMISLTDTEGNTMEVTVEGDQLMDQSVVEHGQLPTSFVSNSIQPASMQYRRLHDCIQAAASRVQDTMKDRATQRVALLVSLIPRGSSFDDQSFHAILVEHICRLLKERDEVYNDKMWVLREAMNIKSLQNGGTFRNVLARKIDEVVTPVFAEVIARVDQNYNLDLIESKYQGTALSHLWLAMFRDPNVMQFHFKAMVTTTERVPGIGSRMAQQEFKCKLPFSWLIKEAFDAHWDNAMGSAGDSNHHLQMKLAEFVIQTPVGHILESFSEENCEELYQYYLHDFVKYVHNCKHVNTKFEEREYQMIYQALYDLAKFRQRDGCQSLVQKIALLHVVYYFNKSEIFWFGQLSCHSPGILVSLEKELTDEEDEYMMLHLHGLKKVFDGFEPPLTKDDPTQNLISWLNNIHLSQTAIQSILSLASQSNLRAKLRLKWQHLRAIQIFVEHILLKHKDLTHFGRRLYLHIKSDPDFLKLATLNKVKRQLNSMENDLKKIAKTAGSSQSVSQIKKCCREFFMEVVSTLCFGSYGTPEAALINMLMDTVFTERKGGGDSQAELVTRDFTPYIKARSDESPVIRSFLLKLLLEHNSEQVKVHISEYFMRSHRALAGSKQDHDLCLLCIQCFEDSLYREASHCQVIEDALACLNEGHVALVKYNEDPQHKLSVEYLEGIAKVRYALSVVASILKERDQANPLSRPALELLDAAGALCTDATLNIIDLSGAGDTVGPVVYLIKLLVRQYGFPCLKQVSEIYPWILPQELRRSNDEEQLVDPFAIYGESYSKLRESVGGAVFGKQFQSLLESTKDLTINDAALLLLAFYSKATLCRASSVPSKQLLPDVLEDLNTFILEYGPLNFSKEMKWMARALIANAQGGTLAQLSVSPHQPLQCRALSALVTHAAAVFFSRQNVEILLPFMNILINPAILVNAYLPTMPEDYLQEARRVLGGSFFVCPRGHPYFVGECGRPVQEVACNICGAKVGGVRHILRSDNTSARTNDTTQTGYVLGDPAARTNVPAPERSLSPAALCVLRALMHCAFIWSSCNNQNAVDGLLQLVKPHVAPQRLSEFFWRQLEKDIELLGRATGRGMDESAMIVHLVLRQILGGNPPTSGTIGVIKTLGDRNARDEWEKVFSTHYMQPVLGSLNQSLTKAMDCVANDENQDHDQLFYLVYERVKVSDENMEPHLWTYRSRITLEHLGQTLQEKSSRNKYRILYAFLQAEPYLRATQYLPDIVRLQQCLYDTFHRRLDRKEAVRKTFGDFVGELASENIRNDYQRRLASLQKAWALVSSRLKTHTRLPVNEEYLLPEITEETTLEYLVPTLSGAGVCTASLVDFLVLTHNDFVEKCKAAVSEQSLSVWREHKVPVTHIHRCHLLDYEQHLLSIVLSHCHYSFKLGEGQNVSFAAVRKKVHPQNPIPARVRQDIISELRSPDRLRDALDVVDIVLGFLSSGGGRAEKSLGEYVDKVLKMKKRRFSQKAREYCELGHILSLWEVLSVELAKQLCLKDQEPFDSINEVYLQDLSIEDGQILEKSLRCFNLDKLLGTLYEFIETYLKHSPENERKWTLLDTLEAFLDQGDLPPIPKFVEEFPGSITLDQTVSTWKYIVQYQDGLKQEG